MLCSPTSIGGCWAPVIPSAPCRSGICRPGALLSADITDPTIAEAVAAVADADAIVVATPVYQAAYSGLLKVFLDLLPQFAFRGKAVLPIVTGGSPAHVLAVDYALAAGAGQPRCRAHRAGLVRPVIAHPAMGRRRSADRPRIAGPGGPGHRRIPGDPRAPQPGDAVPARVDLPGGAGYRRWRGTPTCRSTGSAVGDPRLQPLLADLIVEYGTRYGRPSPHTPN